MVVDDTPIKAEDVFLSDRERLIQLAFRIVQSRAIAEEIVQESWIRWHGRGYAEVKAQAIFRKIVSNLATDWYRSNQSETNALLDVRSMSATSPTSEQIIIVRNELRLIVKTLLKMSDKHVMAFRLRTIEGLTFRQVADRLGMSLGQTHKLIEQVIVELYLVYDS